MTDIISKATNRMLAFDNRAAQLQSVLDQVNAERKRLKDFIETARQLQDESNSGVDDGIDFTFPNMNLFGQVKHGPIHVRKGSLAARAATLIRHNGPLSVAQIGQILVSEGDGVEDFGKFLNTINSAIWRRRDDLFERKGELVDLRTKEFELVEG